MNTQKHKEFIKEEIMCFDGFYRGFTQDIINAFYKKFPWVKKDKRKDQWVRQTSHNMLRRDESMRLVLIDRGVNGLPRVLHKYI